MYKVKEMLLLYAFEVWLVIKEIVVSAIDSVDVLIEEVLRCGDFEEELRIVGMRMRDDCDFLGGEEGDESLH